MCIRGKKEHIATFYIKSQWLRANVCLWDSNTCACAADNGHLERLFL